MTFSTTPPIHRAEELDPLYFQATMTGWIYDDDYILSPKTSITLRHPEYRWSMQPADPGEIFRLDSLIEEALQTVESPYIDDKYITPKSGVYGKHDEILFTSTKPFTFLGEQPEEHERLEMRQVEVGLYLWATYNAEIKATTRFIKLLGDR